MGRSPCCDKNGVKKGPWTAEEDQKLLDYINLHGPGNWRTLPNNAGLKRCGKSCRLRWANYLRPDIKRGRFSFEEEETIIQLHSILGNKWSAIAHRLPGRTDNEIKNYWNTHIRKRLFKNGIDPVTHAPRLDFQDLSNILNLQNLLNPDLLKLASVLASIKRENIQQNQLHNLLHLLQPNYQFQNPIISKPEITPVLNQEQPLQQRSKIDFDDEFSRKDVIRNLEDSNLPPLSENLTGFESMAGTPDHTPLNSASTFLNAEQDQGGNYSSSFKFEIPECFDIGDFL